MIYRWQKFFVRWRWLECQQKNLSKVTNFTKSIDVDANEATDVDTDDIANNFPFYFSSCDVEVADGVAYDVA